MGEETISLNFCLIHSRFEVFLWFLNFVFAKLTIEMIVELVPDVMKFSAVLFSFVCLAVYI